MVFPEIMSISHRYMEILNPSTPEKIIKLGKLLRLKEANRVIDFGCGCAEPLILWAEEFGINGIGIDISEDFCDRARKKLARRGLSDRIQIVCSNGADYVFEERAFDAATCIGSTFIFGGYQQTIQVMKRAVHQNGRLGIGETHWLGNQVDPGYAQQQTTTHTEAELARFTREEGFELEYIIRASRDDWDRYVSDNWYALMRWLEENPKHPDYEQVFNYFRADQDHYLQFQSQYMGWAMYCLAPGKSDLKGGRLQK
ncbi:MAG: SAM-dependent methyltransferase [Candidatus Saccharicenans sp.]|uniref:SAM-dependent methyltransferase n=1 Tax=Candidatus Saccharicenans sp. TaxID=2819258 RepID=UPI004049CBDF